LTNIVFSRLAAFGKTNIVYFYLNKKLKPDFFITHFLCQANTVQAE